MVTFVARRCCVWLFLSFIPQIFAQLGQNWSQFLGNETIEPLPAVEGDAVVHDGTIYALSGVSVYRSADGSSLDLVLETAPFQPDAALVSFDGKLWTIGKLGFDSPFLSIWPSSDDIAWTLGVQTMAISSRVDFATVVYSSRIYLTGGHSGLTHKRDIWERRSQTSNLGRILGPIPSGFGRHRR